MRGLAIIAAVMCAGAVHVHAQDDPLVFTPPAGCVGDLTIQGRSCEVTHIYNCAADTAGERWSITFDAFGPRYIGKVDRETQWLESYDLFPTKRYVLVQPADDPASLTELMETGVDSFDFQQRGPDEVQRFVGFDRIVSDSVVIDGETLLQTEFSVRRESTKDGDFTVTGTEYIIPRLRHFLSGSYRIDRDGTTTELELTPIDFIYSGEPGFFATTPLYECEPTLARYASPTKGTDK
ncbi:MAG: hypothetical protein AAFQ58_08195 [Pseudomonadota bacterium]